MTFSVVRFGLRYATYPACLMLVLVAPVAPVSAAQLSVPLVVSATVLSVCGVVATPLVFGNYSATDTSPVDASALITATCTAGVAYTISLDAGTGSAATVAARKMTSGGNTLGYAIYTDTNHTTVWGDGTHSTSTVGATAGLLPDIYTAYGRIPTGQQAAAGAYLDSVTVTITY